MAGGIVDIAVEGMVVEEAAKHCLLEDCRWVGWACKHSRSAAGAGAEWNEGVAAESASSSFGGWRFVRRVVIPCTVEGSSDDVVGTCRFAWAATPTRRAVEGAGRNWRVACEAGSCAAVASTLLVRRLPRLRLPPRHRLPPFRGSRPVPCARVECHTRPVSRITACARGITDVGISRQRLANVSRRKLVQLLVVAEDDDGDIDRTQDRQLMCFLEQAAFSLEKSSAVVSAGGREEFARRTRIDSDRP